MPDIQKIKMSDIDLDDTTYQCRSTLNDEAIEDYSQVNPDDFKDKPELRWKSDGRYVIVAGHHRIRAFKKAGHEDVDAIVHCDGTESDCLIKSIRSNASHGERLSSADRRSAIEKLLLLLNRENKCLTTSQIAEMVGMTSPTVEKIRTELVKNGKMKEPAVRTTSAGVHRRAKNNAPNNKELGEFVRRAKALADKAQKVRTTDWTKMDAGERAGYEAQLKLYISEMGKVLVGANFEPENKEDASGMIQEAPAEVPEAETAAA